MTYMYETYMPIADSATSHESHTAEALLALVGGFNGRDPAPLYMQLQRRLADLINNKVLSPSDALPPERELADRMRMSRITVRKAIAGLVAAGLLTRRRGAGTFVSAPQIRAPARLTSFTEDMEARGHATRSQWLLRTQGGVTPEEALALNLSPGAPVIRLHRLRFAGNQPIALMYATVRGDCLSSANFEGDSLYDAMRMRGKRPARALQRLRSINLEDDQARLLQSKPGVAGLFMERRGFLANGQAVEFTRSYFLGEAYDVVTELSHGD
jgi:GntR family transcriptional regulator